jgi:hypothetical protein
MVRRLLGVFVGRASGWRSCYSARDAVIHFTLLNGCHPALTNRLGLVFFGCL